VLWANQDPSIPDWEKSDGSAGETWTGFRPTRIWTELL